MKENTTQPYIDAHDAAWDSFVQDVTKAFRRGVPPPSKWEAFAAGFAAGVTFGRNNEEPPPFILERR